MSKIVIKPSLGLLLCKSGKYEQGRISFEIQAARRLLVTSTFVGEESRGQGIAELMTQELLGWAVRKRYIIVPQCSYTVKYIERHTDYHRYLDTYDASLEILEAFKTKASAERARQTSRFFKAADGEYGFGDIFLGISLPDIRKHIKEFAPWTEATVKSYLTSTYHEVRLTGFLILVRWFSGSKSEQNRRVIYEFYREYLPYCNNWDIVDSSAPTLIGKYLVNIPQKERMEILLPLATSGELWQQRIAMVGTLGLIMKGEEVEALSLARYFLPHKHNLIRKAVGWMLREVGKRISKQHLIEFLDENAPQMSSVTLSYATEHLSPELRQYYRTQRKK